jgi:hypothetical protein
MLFRAHRGRRQTALTRMCRLGPTDEIEVLPFFGLFFLFFFLEIPRHFEFLIAGRLVLCFMYISEVLCGLR